MKRFTFPLLLLTLSVLTFNCQKEVSNGSNNSPSNTPLNPAPVTATIQGKVVDENNQPASGVVIKVGTKTATTNAKGFFRITQAALDKNASLVTAEKNGYFKAYRVFQATIGANHVMVKLIKKSLTGTIASATGGDVTLTNGSKITLPANGVVKATGGSYSGTINVYAAYIDPTAADISQTIPGSFLGTDKNGNSVSLTSFGMLAVELESVAGEKLQIASGKTATLNAPIPTSLLATAPVTIPLWYVDEQTGLWKEEGVATKNGNNYTGEVRHFSFWNYDICVPVIHLTLMLKNPGGLPLVNMLVKLTRPNGSSSYGYTDSLGVVCGLVPKNEALQLNVYSSCGNSIYSQNIGPFSVNTALPPIIINISSNSQLTIQGTLLNCSGNPVTNGTAIVDFDYPRYISTNASGQFSVVLISCTGSPGTVTITGIDNAAQQQGSPVVLPVTAPVTNTGSIIACGTSTAQYINYTLDGTAYNLTNLTDSLSGSTNGQIGLYFTSLWSNYQAGPRYFMALLQHTTIGAGSYPIYRFEVNNYTRIQLPSPGDINFTTFPATSGGYYEGNFSFNFKDSSDLTVTHTINANFRIKRY